MRWPRKLRLVATGSKIDEREDGDFRVGHWKRTNPFQWLALISGEYASTSVTAANYSIDVYANRQLELELARRLENTASPDLACWPRWPPQSNYRNLNPESPCLPIPPRSQTTWKRNRRFHPFLRDL